MGRLLGLLLILQFQFLIVLLKGVPDFNSFLVFLLRLQAEQSVTACHAIKMLTNVSSLASLKSMTCQTRLLFSDNGHLRVVALITCKYPL